MDSFLYMNDTRTRGLTLSVKCLYFSGTMFHGHGWNQLAIYWLCSRSGVVTRREFLWLREQFNKVVSCEFLVYLAERLIFFLSSAIRILSHKATQKRGQWRQIANEETSVVFRGKPRL